MSQTTDPNCPAWAIDWTMPRLRRAERHETQQYAMGFRYPSPCGDGHRASTGVCAACIRAEINRRSPAAALACVAIGGGA